MKVSGQSWNGTSKICRAAKRASQSRKEMKISLASRAFFRQNASNDSQKVVWRRRPEGIGPTLYAA